MQSVKIEKKKDSQLNHSVKHGNRKDLPIFLFTQTWENESFITNSFSQTRENESFTNVFK